MVETTIAPSNTSSDEIALLDAVHRRLLRGEVEAIPVLIQGLSRLKAQMASQRWTAFAQVLSRRHPVIGLLHEDPFTARAFSKPRGYAGDAVLMDFIYAGLPAHVARETSSRGRRIFECTATLSGSARAVRQRRNLMASTVDRVAGQVHRPSILSVASGHLREALWTRALASSAIGEYVAFDQDAASLETVRGELGSFGVTTQEGSVRDLLQGRLSIGMFDLIYSAGLYDYLNDESARRLTRVLMGALRPGAELLIANFLPGFATSAYMECFMDWQLICRSESQMLALAADSSDFETRVSVDEDRYVAYLSIRRRPRARA